MFDCKKLFHPFQNDPGTSQRQRIIDDLLSDSVKIDNRSLVDLLHYISELSSSINYYDKDLNIGDWKPFFERSLPFQIASISKYDGRETAEKIELYRLLFNRNPSGNGLQLMGFFIYYNSFLKVNAWYQSLKGSGLPLETILEERIRQKMAILLKDFIALSNASAKWFCTRKIDFTPFLNTDDSDVWELTIASLYSVATDFQKSGTTQCDKLRALFESIVSLFPSLLEGMGLIASEAETSIQQSLVPHRHDLRENHEPHLALMFAFISLFQKMQGELNKKKGDHLRFFYTDVLRIKPVDSTPDKAHIIFEIQKLLTDEFEKFRVKKGVAVNAGRDQKNEDIIFNTDEEIIVNETKVESLKTLYLNNERTEDGSFVEGVYMAPQSTLADGVENAFKEDPVNWFTVGNNVSKFIEPGKKNPKAYPLARLGFIIASPVLFLQEGHRTITITLASKLGPACQQEGLPEFLPAVVLYKKVRRLIRKGFYVIDEDLISLALSKGIPQNIVDQINSFLPDRPVQGCYPKPVLKTARAVVTAAKWRTQFFNLLADENIKAAVSEIFKERRIFRIHLSGADEWVTPSRVKIRMGPLQTPANSFSLKLKITLDETKPAITFFNKLALGEDLATTQPVVKVELDDNIKLLRGFNPKKNSCCLTRKTGNAKRNISFYHFFREVKVQRNFNGDNTRIDVRVCGVKNFVVQNDENVMDVNGPVYPFGTRPDVSDFDMVNPTAVPSGNAVGPNFFIGSKEIFCKKWKRVQLNINWKNKPLNFNDYYKAYTKREDPPASGNIVFGLDEKDFEYKLSFLNQGLWIDDPVNRRVFDIHLNPMPNPAPPFICIHKSIYEYAILIDNGLIPPADQVFSLDSAPFTKLDVNTRNGFIKLNLRKQDFGHKNYAFVLARQMMAYSKLPEETIESAVYYNANGDPIVIDFKKIQDEIEAAHTTSVTALNDTNTLDGMIDPDVLLGWNWNPNAAQRREVRNIVRGPNPPVFITPFTGLKNLTSSVESALQGVIDKIDTEKLKKFAAVIPNEPWTPIISNISLDYTATAEIQDMDLIHLHPFTETSKKEEIELTPPLFPVFCDEGSLFIGLKDFQPGSNLNLLFQLAEATADSETGKEKVNWAYLDNNEWKSLRTGFEIVSDGTDELTTSGVIQYALPGNMTSNNSVMQKNLYWIKASLPKNSKSVSETIGIHAQAIKVTFNQSPTNDTLRLAVPLAAGSIAKLVTPDPAIKALTQPYESFGGKLPELDSSYYLRVSEHLRHKGRAIQKWDYERLVLEEFSIVFKAKCINHSFQTDAKYYKNDIPYAPGYVIVAVIPDLNKLKAGNSFDPKVPVSLLETINTFIGNRTSPFVRFKAVNPRYEKVNFCITVRLTRGSDPQYYKEKLKNDLRELLAPWAVGKYDKLSFGQCVYRSDVLRFLEQSSYVNFIKDLQMSHETDAVSSDIPKVCPLSPRSILIAGDIDVQIDPDECDRWCSASEKVCNETELILNNLK